MFRIHLTDQEHTKWDQHLQEALLAIRQRVNRVTGFSPAELFLGRQLKLTGDWNLTHDQVKEDLETWHGKNQEEIKKRNRCAEERTRKEAEKIDAPEEEDFQAGMIVLRKNHILSNKLQKFHAGMAPKWLGPYEVEKKLGKGVYLLKANPPVKVHASELKKLNRPLRGAIGSEDQREILPPDGDDHNGDQSSSILHDDHQDKEDNDSNMNLRYNLRPRRNVVNR